MAILKVARRGHPALRAAADPVPPEHIGTPTIHGLIDDMIETMVEYDGAGLAAPQVHVSLQIVVFEVDGNPRYPDADSIPLTVLINPKVTALSTHTEEDWEGCLSLPELRGRVPRYTQVRVEACDRSGKPLSYVAKKFQARVVQHECDHLLGKVFVDRMKSMESLTFLREFMRYEVGEKAQDD